jgi:hypothetical protein
MPAGTINDLAVIHLSIEDYMNAEKQLKRALLMVERSYRIDNHLRSTLLANLSNVHRLTGNKELCLKHVDQLLPLLNGKHQQKKLDAVDIANLNPAEDQESLDEFWRSLTEAKRVETDKLENQDREKSKTRDKFYYTRQVFTSVRSIQFSLCAGHCIGINRLHEEGLVYMNKAFGMILLNSVGPQQEGDLSTWDTFLLSSALSKLSELSEDSMKKRGRGLSAKHIEHDNVSLLFKLPYFQNQFPSVSDLDLSLASPHRDLKNAATQIFKSRSSSGDTPARISNLSEYEMLTLTGTGVVGVALLDIEHHCPQPLPATSEIPSQV